MQANIRTGTENASSTNQTTNQLYTLAGVCALLYVVFGVASIALTDWNNPAVYSTPTIVLGVLGFVALLPVLLAVYQHLRPASATISGIAIVCGVLALIGGATGTVVGYESTLGIVGGIGASFGMLVFFGLSGYLALTSKLLPAGWAYLSIVVGLMAVSAGIISGVASSTSDLTGIAWTVFSLATLVWGIWTAVEFLRRGREASAAA